jgi:hypothetical protein
MELKKHPSLCKPAATDAADSKDMTRQTEASAGYRNRELERESRGGFVAVH